MALLQPTREREVQKRLAIDRKHPMIEWSIILACIVGVIWFIVSYCMGGQYSGL